MKKIIITLMAWLILSSLLLAACQSAPQPTAESSSPIRVLAAQSFLADIAQNVAGDRLTVEVLVPAGLDPHAFEPTPQDVVKIAQSDLLILNGAGLEAWAEKILENAGGERLVVEASDGLTMRQTEEGEEEHAGEEEHFEGDGHDHQGDPHFWFDPNQVVRYVENIRDGLIEADPAGAEVYRQNAAAYLAELEALDAWIQAQVAQIPPERRLLITDHDSFGYFAERYGFEIIGAIIPSFSTGAAPSAQQMADLINRIRATGAPAIFLESGADARLAEQIAAEANIRVVADLYTHSLGADGQVLSYIEMMKYNTNAIVTALK